MKINSYIKSDKLPFPFCPGCSHGPVLGKIDRALAALNLKSHEVVIVTDIGCVGLSDQWFNTHTFHGLHGRSVAYGHGLKLASPNLHVLVFIGDGGAGIGLNHLVTAARRNIGITVILFNNMNFGMTGGEHSITTPEDSITSTDKFGHIERPIKFGETLKLNGAAFVTRRAFYDEDLTELIKMAIKTRGFSFVEVMEFCTAYYTSFNKFKKSDMEVILNSKYHKRMLYHNDDSIEYTEACKKLQKKYSTIKTSKKIVIKKIFKNNLVNKGNFIFSGSAGQKIVSTTTAFAKAGIFSGLNAVQRDDFPVTVKTGHSIAYLKLSGSKNFHIGIKIPDFLFILSENGLSKVTSYLKLMTHRHKIFILKDLRAIETNAEIIKIDPDKAGIKIPNEYILLSVLSAFLKAEQIFPIKALIKSVTSGKEKSDYEKTVKFITGVGTEIFC